jgi:SNF2 family DNA or RNA helicase
MLWLDMGLGKSVVTLTSAEFLLRQGILKGILIVAPLRVCRLVWRQEAAKWEHTERLTFSMITGTIDQRSRALMKKADIYLINYENLTWLSAVLKTHYIGKGRSLPFDGLVWDEITKVKNSTSKRSAAVAEIIKSFRWRTGLTGSPASNGYKDLHGQYLVLDDGARLGEKKTMFLERYFNKSGYGYEPHQDAKDVIHRLIIDITLEMSAADYNPLPDLIVNDVEVELTPELRAKYEEMEAEMFLKLDSGEGVELFNKVSLMNKCLQFSNGAAYLVPGEPMWEAIHELKLEALDDIISEANGNQILLAYAYKMDAERIMKRYANLRPINLTDCKSESALNNAMYRWTTGDCQLMIGHPGSMGHGIDGLQSAGHILVWFGLNWSLDLFDQFNARIRRQGQGVPVICHRILTVDTVDALQRAALSEKTTTQEDLRKIIKLYRQQKTLDGGAKINYITD